MLENALQVLQLHPREPDVGDLLLPLCGLGTLDGGPRGLLLAALLSAFAAARLSLGLGLAAFAVRGAGGSDADIAAFLSFSFVSRLFPFRGCSQLRFGLSLLLLSPLSGKRDLRGLHLCKGGNPKRKIRPSREPGSGEGLRPSGVLPFAPPWDRLKRVPRPPLTVRFFPLLVDPQLEEAGDGCIRVVIGIVAALRLTLRVPTAVEEAVSFSGGCAESPETPGSRLKARAVAHDPAPLRLLWRPVSFQGVCNDALCGFTTACWGLGWLMCACGRASAV